MCTVVFNLEVPDLDKTKKTIMLKNAHKNQLLVVYQNKAINISISKWKARLDKYTCFISLHAGKPAQQKNSKLHDRLI